MNAQTFECDKALRIIELEKVKEGKTKEYMKEYDEGKGIFVSSILPYLSMHQLRDDYRMGKPSFSITLNRDIRVFTEGLFKGTPLSDGIIEAIHGWVDRNADAYVDSIEYHGTTIDTIEKVKVFGIFTKKKSVAKTVTRITFVFKEV